MNVCMCVCVCVCVCLFVSVGFNESGSKCEKCKKYTTLKEQGQQSHSLVKVYDGSLKAMVRIPRMGPW